MTAKTAKPNSGISDTKANLKRLLVRHKGDSSHPEVKEALDDLVRLAEEERGDDAAEWSPATSKDTNGGRWRSITTPSFPGRLPDEEGSDSGCKFTLGRMTFGMFKPTEMVCAVEDIVNVVEPIDGGGAGRGDDGRQQGEGGGNGAPLWTQTYTFEVIMDLETPSSKKLPARLVNHGVCFPLSPTRLGVKFSGGTLGPGFKFSDNSELAALWEETFRDAIAREADAQSYIGRLGTWAMGVLTKAMMGLEPPVDTENFTQTYSIGRPKVGHADIIYLDEDFRVTRGHKGTLVVVERLAEVEAKR